MGISANKGKVAHTLLGLGRNLEREISTHRVTDKGKPFRRRFQNIGCHGAQIFTAADIRHNHFCACRKTRNRVFEQPTVT
jgi:hypothetical protein